MSEPASSPGRAEPVLRMENVSKSFPDSLALDGVGLELHPGEVRALLGENGSGKSTLIKILAGFHQPDFGAQAWADGEPLRLGSAAHARAAGVRFIHQDLGLVRDLDVVDNLALGERYVGRRWLSHRREADEARRLLAQYGVELDVHAPLWSLSPAEQTIVAVVRALRDGLERFVLVLDEPTGSLAASEVARLFDVIRAIRDRGGSLLYVTHRLQEVFEIADQVTVLRDGRVVADRPVAGLGEEQLVELLVGGAVEEVFPGPPPAGGEPAMDAEGISGAGVDDVSLTVGRGEILGIAGIIGSGREELLRLLFGAQRWTSGRLRVGPREFSSISVPQAIDAGLAYAASRGNGGMTRDLSIRENVTLPKIPVTHRGWWLSTRREAEDVRGWLDRLDVRPPAPERPLASLSGGNQQRVVLARWLRCRPQVLMLEGPTLGVDIGAKAEIYRALVDAAREGTAVVVSSSDAEELAAICDRVIVMRDGRISTELRGAQLTEQVIVEQSLLERKVVPA